MLRTIVSRQIADKTNRWSNLNKKKLHVTNKQVELDVNLCLNEFEKTRDSENKIRNELQRDFFLELTYEDMAKNIPEMIENIFDFLKVEYVQVKSSHKKQNSESLEELITNYREVKGVLEKSEWSYLLNLE